MSEYVVPQIKIECYFQFAIEIEFSKFVIGVYWLLKSCSKKC